MLGRDGPCSAIASTRLRSLPTDTLKRLSPRSFRWAAAGVVVAMLVLGLAARTYMASDPVVHSLRPNDPAFRPTPGQPCPPTTPPLNFDNTGRLRSHILPGHPSALTVCRYSALDDTPPASLVAMAVLPARPAIAALQRELDAGQSINGKSIFNCPAAHGDVVIVIADYGTHALAASIALSGCSFVGNGVLNRFRTPGLADALVAVLPACELRRDGRQRTWAVPPQAECPHASLPE